MDPYQNPIRKALIAAQAKKLSDIVSSDYEAREMISTRLRQVIGYVANNISEIFDKSEPELDKIDTTSQEIMDGFCEHQATLDYWTEKDVRMNATTLSSLFENITQSRCMHAHRKLFKHALKNDRLVQHLERDAQMIGLEYALLPSTQARALRVLFPTPEEYKEHIMSRFYVPKGFEFSMLVPNDWFANEDREILVRVYERALGDTSAIYDAK